LGNARFGPENRQAAAQNRAALRYKPKILAASFCHDQFFRASLELEHRNLARLIGEPPHDHARIMESNFEAEVDRESTADRPTQGRAEGRIAAITPHPDRQLRQSADRPTP